MVAVETTVDNWKWPFPEKGQDLVNARNAGGQS
jgi:hypothetical protein